MMLKVKCIAIRSIIAFSIIFYISCTQSHTKYENQIEKNLSEFQILADELIAAYSNISSIELMPSKENNGSGFSPKYDNSIFDFCEKYDVIAIKVFNTWIDSSGELTSSVEFFVHDNNVKYVYANRGFINQKNIDNNRISIKSINPNWQFIYERKEW